VIDKSVISVILKSVVGVVNDFCRSVLAGSPS